MPNSDENTRAAVTPKALYIFKADDTSAVQILMPGMQFDENNPAVLMHGSKFEPIPEQPYPTAS